VLLASGSWGGPGAADATVAVSGTVHFPPRYEALGIAGGRLRFQSVDGPERAYARVSADRSYSARLQRGVRYEVLVDRLYIGRQRVPGGEFRVAPVHIAVPAHGPPPQPDLRLLVPDGNQVLAVQVETRGGVRVPDARVELTGLDERNRFRVPLGVAATDVLGVARFAGLARGRIRVRLVDSGPFGRTEQTLGTRRSTTMYTDELVVGRDPPSTKFVLLDAGVLDVTVDAQRLAQAPPVSVWTTDAELVAGPRTQPDVAGSSAVFRFDSLPPGRYRVVAQYPDGAVFREVQVASGRATPLLLTRARAVGATFDVVVRWERFPDAVRRARFYLTALDGDFPTAAYEAVRGGAVRRTYGPAPHGGVYLLRYPALGLARRMDASARARWVLDFTPPKPGFLSCGSRTVTVRLTRDGEPLDDLLVGLRSPAHARTPGVEWMRYTGSRGGVARFADVPAGWYEVHVIDRVLGREHGIEPRVRKLGVSRRDVAIAWELGDGAR